MEDLPLGNSHELSWLHLFGGGGGGTLTLQMVVAHNTYPSTLFATDLFHKKQSIIES